MSRWQISKCKIRGAKKVTARLIKRLFNINNIIHHIHAEKKAACELAEYFYESNIIKKKCREIFITSNLRNCYGLCTKKNTVNLFLARTYITSIINSLMIYGIFILFYSLSCPTAHYILTLFAFSHTQREKGEWKI